MKTRLLGYIAIAIVLCMFGVSATAWGQATLARWNFEAVTTTNTGTTPTVSVGSAVADSGLLTTGSLFTALHASASTVWSNPAGNGSLKSISSNNWSVGDYYQFSFSTNRLRSFKYNMGSNWKRNWTTRF